MVSTTSASGSAVLIADRLLGRFTSPTRAAARAADRLAVVARDLQLRGAERVDSFTVDLNQLLADMDRILRRTIGEDVHIELVQGAGLWACEADPTEVKNVVLTFCLNARDAMPTGGRLTIRTTSIGLDEEACASRPQAAPGNYVCLAVADSGAAFQCDLASAASISRRASSSRRPRRASA